MIGNPFSILNLIMDNLAILTAPEPERSFGHRKLYDIPKLHGSPSLEKPEKDLDSKSGQKSQRCEGSDLFPVISKSVIGTQLVFRSPFGNRRVVYCDYTASGRSLSFIEDYIRDQILPHYGNTHTTISVTSLQTTLFREEARSIIRNSVNAAESDAVLFVGSGCTGAMHKLIRAMNLKEPAVVFVGPFEHHSVLLPWRESGSEVILIPENEEGTIDTVFLEDALKKHSGSKRQLIGCFSAASNITGIMSDTTLITVLLHRYSALAIWDYAAAAPYNEIDMNPLVPDDPKRYAHKDAIVFSVHKFIGGVSTPGVLIAKKHLFKNPVPEHHGGGTVFFVDSENHRYLKEIENREEGGTAAIVESIRAGLVFRLKDAITASVIMKRDSEIVERAFKAWSGVENLILLGNMRAPRLPIFSFVIQDASTNRLLHHNFVSAVLNDLFGLQSRSGCACAGPYAQSLLGIVNELSKEIERTLLEDPRLEMHRWEVEFSQREVLRPGFVRINLPYFFTDEEIDFVCEAVKMVAQVGWKLLPLYRFNPETGEWRHQDNTLFQDRKWLSSIQFTADGLSYPNFTYKPDPPENYAAVLAAAREILENAVKLAYRTHLVDQDVAFDPKASSLRWFLLPSEARRLLCNIMPLPQRAQMPFMPRRSGELGSSSCCDQSLECASVDAKRDRCCVIRPKTNEQIKTDNSYLSNSVTAKWHSPTKAIWKPMLTAINEFGMLKDGDKVLVCLSGGKDSLSLLHAMRQFKFYGKSQGLRIEVGAVTVDPLTSSYDPSSLIPYLKALDVPYFYERQGIMDQAAALEECNSICSFCSRMKRGRLYSCARREGYNVLAFGQHLDDLAESFFMSVFHNGRLRTMKAAYTVIEGDLRMIRPLVFVREKDTRHFAESRHLPVVAENCPACFEVPKERFRVKQLLAAQELLYPGLYDSLKIAMKPLMAIKTAGAENAITKIPEILDELFRSRNINCDKSAQELNGIHDEDEE
ncbi:uncharacterized protein LOC129591589 [Paramacrobiotus metropolitanus]|uniref:uncharacterized protein LOC129591589 n=1 Tax=Paramacrobiotus metropolitanus TaxID=2943436 RepID=UPI002445B5B1|nr:uncharacterized protein LOC129591589 [Paramacrobiotus metropolitanus]